LKEAVASWGSRSSAVSPALVLLQGQLPAPGLGKAFVGSVLGLHHGLGPFLRRTDYPMGDLGTLSRLLLYELGVSEQGSFCLDSLTEGLVVEAFRTVQCIFFLKCSGVNLMRGLFGSFSSADFSIAMTIFCFCSISRLFLSICGLSDAIGL